MNEKQSIFKMVWDEVVEPRPVTPRFIVTSQPIPPPRRRLADEIVERFYRRPIFGVIQGLVDEGFLVHVEVVGIRYTGRIALTIGDEPDNVYEHEICWGPDGATCFT